MYSNCTDIYHFMTTTVNIISKYKLTITIRLVGVGIQRPPWAWDVAGSIPGRVNL